MHNVIVSIKTAHANAKLAMQYIFFPLLIFILASLVTCLLTG